MPDNIHESDLIKVWHVQETEKLAAERISRGFTKFYEVDARELYLAFSRLQNSSPLRGLIHPFAAYSAPSHMGIVAHMDEPLQRPLQLTISTLDNEIDDILLDGTNRLLVAAGWTKPFNESEYPHVKVGNKFTEQPQTVIKSYESPKLNPLTGKREISTLPTRYEAMIPIAPDMPSRKIIIVIPEGVDIWRIQDILGMHHVEFRPYNVFLPTISDIPGQVITGEIFEIGGGKPPTKGLVVANIGSDNKIYYGEVGDIHSDLYERFHPKLINSKKIGFAGPDGKFLTREQALIVAERYKIIAKNLDKELDALDYRESISKIDDTNKDFKGFADDKLRPLLQDEIDAANKTRTKLLSIIEQEKVGILSKIDPNFTLKKIADTFPPRIVGTMAGGDPFFIPPGILSDGEPIDNLFFTKVGFEYKNNLENFWNRWTAFMQTLQTEDMFNKYGMLLDYTGTQLSSSFIYNLIKNKSFDDIIKLSNKLEAFKIESEFFVAMAEDLAKHGDLSADVLKVLTVLFKQQNAAMPGNIIGIRHALKNLLTPIQGYAQALLPLEKSTAAWQHLNAGLFALEILERPDLADSQTFEELAKRLNKKSYILPILPDVTNIKLNKQQLQEVIELFSNPKLRSVLMSFGYNPKEAIKLLGLDPQLFSEEQIVKLNKVLMFLQETASDTPKINNIATNRVTFEIPQEITPLIIDTEKPIINYETSNQHLVIEEDLVHYNLRMSGPNGGYYYIAEIDAELASQYFEKNKLLVPIDGTDEATQNIETLLKEKRGINQYPTIDFNEVHRVITTDSHTFVEGNFAINEGNHRLFVARKNSLRLEVAFRTKEEATAFLKTIGQKDIKIFLHTVPPKTLSIPIQTAVKEVTKVLSKVENDAVKVALEIAEREKVIATIRRGVNLAGWGYIAVDILTRGVGAIKRDDLDPIAWRQKIADSLTTQDFDPRVLRLSDFDLKRYLTTVAIIDQKYPRLADTISDEQIQNLWIQSFKSFFDNVQVRTKILQLEDIYNSWLKDLNITINKKSINQLIEIRNKYRTLLANKNNRFANFEISKLGLAHVEKIANLTDKDIEYLNMDVPELYQAYDVTDKGIFRWEIEAAIKRVKWLNNLINFGSSMVDIDKYINAIDELSNLISDIQSLNEQGDWMYEDQLRISNISNSLKPILNEIERTNFLDMELLQKRDDEGMQYRNQVFALLLTIKQLRQNISNVQLTKVVSLLYPFILDQTFSKLTREQLEAFQNRILVNIGSVILSGFSGQVWLAIGAILSLIDIIMNKQSLFKPSSNTIIAPEITNENTKSVPELNAMGAFLREEDFTDKLTLDKEFKFYLNIERGKGLVDTIGNIWINEDKLNRFKLTLSGTGSPRERFLFDEDFEKFQAATSLEERQRILKENNDLLTKFQNGVTPELAKLLKEKGYLSKTRADLLIEIEKKRQERFIKIKQKVQEEIEKLKTNIPDTTQPQNNIADNTLSELGQILQDTILQRKTTSINTVPVQEEGIGPGIIREGDFTDSPVIFEYLLDGAEKGDIGSLITLLKNGMLPQSVFDKLIATTSGPRYQPLSYQTDSVPMFRKINNIDILEEAFKHGIKLETLTPIQKDIFVEDVIKQKTLPNVLDLPFNKFQSQIEYKKYLEQTELNRLQEQDNLLRRQQGLPEQTNRVKEFAKGTIEYEQARLEAEATHDKHVEAERVKAFEKWQKEHPEAAKEQKQQSIKEYIDKNEDIIEKFAQDVDNLRVQLDIIDQQKKLIRDMKDKKERDARKEMEIATKSKIKDFKGKLVDDIKDNQSLKENSNWLSSNYGEYTKTEKSLEKMQKEWGKMTDAQKRSVAGQILAKKIGATVDKLNQYLEKWNDGVQHVSDLMTKAQNAEMAWAKDIKNDTLRENYNQSIRDAYQAYREQYLNAQAREFAQAQDKQNKRDLYGGGPGTSQGDKKSNGHSYGCGCSKCAKITDDAEEIKRLKEDAEEARKAVEDAEKQRKKEEDEQKEKEAQEKLKQLEEDLPSDEEEAEDVAEDAVKSTEELIDELEDMLEDADAVTQERIKRLLDKLRNALNKLKGKLKQRKPSDTLYFEVAEMDVPYLLIHEPPKNFTQDKVEFLSDMATTSKLNDISPKLDIQNLFPDIIGKFTPLQVTYATQAVAPPQGPPLYVNIHPNANFPILGGIVFRVGEEPTNPFDRVTDIGYEPPTVMPRNVATSHEVSSTGVGFKPKEKPKPPVPEGGGGGSGIEPLDMFYFPQSTENTLGSGIFSTGIITFVLGR